ncbi:hypothetical protein DFP72DRAFT_985401 [Ephemerocybe angulata]|uniref:LIM zinc-binding domain-containing protein n=1 Tax=Ephemerocybe angulata TaxID=980116 RepID=A0A8H6IIR5_9AGAR|nr:hypothetical protein DFP72DRAFT_985401 [Tulosesus angulatus]
MGFCRRCGEIVATDRCKCGGRPVEPIVPFKRDSTDLDSQDKWTKTYASNRASTSPTRSSAPAQANQAPRSSVPRSRSPTKPFPRPITSTSNRQTSVGARVTDYIASTTSRPRSPLKQHVTGPNPEAGILPSLNTNDTTLSKVYGSVLQPKETLATFSCAICSSAFPPDATIYPDPLQPNSSHRFLCRPCFVDNGGSKGPCDACSRPVLTLKAEGGFIHAANKYWHKRCFNCAGCEKNIGDSPMVDLVGQPCCPSCFDTCLNRETPKKKKQTPVDSPKPDPLGKLKSSQGAKSQESSPIIGELEQRLGVKKREGSPALEELTQRLSHIGRDINSRYSLGDSPSSSPTLNRSQNGRGGRRDDDDKLSRRSLSSSPTKVSPLRTRATGSPIPAAEAVEEMKKRLLKGPPSSSPGRSSPFSSTQASSSRDRVLSLQSSSSTSDYGSFSPRIPPTPDLISDYSDTMTQSSFSEPGSPPRGVEDDIFNSKGTVKGYGSRQPRHEYFNPLDEPIIEETHSQLNTPTKTPTRTPNRSAQDPNNNHTPLKGNSMATSSPLRLSTSTRALRETKDSPSPSEASQSNCARCDGKLFTMGSGGSFITVPSGKTGLPERYHVRCFTCHICDGIFEKASNGQATFVQHAGRACHPECAPKERVIVHKSPSTPALRSRAATVSARPTHSPTPASSKPIVSSRFEQGTISSVSGDAPVPRFGGPRNACPGCKKAVSPMERGVIPGPQGTKWHATCLVCGGKKTRPVSWYGREEEKGKPGCGKRLDSAAKTDGDGGVWCRECILGIQSSPSPSPTKTPLSPTYTGSGKMVPQFTGTTTIARQFTGMGPFGGAEGGLTRQMTGSGLNPNRSMGSVRPRPKSVIGMRKQQER